MSYYQTFLDFFSTSVGKWTLIIVFAFILFLFVRLLGQSINFFKNERYPLGQDELPFRKWVSRLAFWKAYLPDEFRKFLCKYDGTLPKSIYDQYKSDYNREMEVYPRQMLGIYFLIDVVMTLIFLRIIFAFDHHMFGEDDHPMHVMIEHIDVAGLINGALAVILAIIIARIVESENDDKKEELDNNIKKIRDATGKIDDTNKTIKESTEILKDEVEKILSSYTALERKDSFEERLEAHRHILDMAWNNLDNSLYYMSFSADFGSLRSQNISVLMEEANEKPPKANNLYRAHNSFSTITEELFLKLWSLCRDRGESVFLAFLDTSEENRQHISRHQDYLERVLGDETAEVISWQKQNEPEKEFADRIGKYLANTKDDEIAVYVDFKGDTTDSNLNKRLQKELVRKNIERINDLKSTKAQVTLMDRMSFQFILTMPGKIGGIRNRTNQCCVITFSNIDAIGDNAGVYAFQSTDKDTIDNLKRIFETYSKQQISRDQKTRKKLSEWKNFVELFNIHPGRDCHNVLKFKILDEVVKEFLNGVAVADVQAALSIQQMFRRIEETVPEIKYSIQTSKIDKDRTYEYKDDLFDKEGTYFAIGLFGEGEAPATLAEYVGKHYSNTLSFIRRQMPIDLNTPISEHSDLLYNVLKVNGYEFNGIWTPDTKRDIGFIAKLKLDVKGKDITVFIVGGINHFGTERIGAYLSENWHDIHRQAKSKPFLAVYDIDDIADIKIKQRHFFLPDSKIPGKWTERTVTPSAG